MKKTVIVRGPALSRSGYGEHCRFLLRSLKHHEEYFDIHLLNTNWGKTNWLHEDNEERAWIDSVINKTLMYHQEMERDQKQIEYDISLQVTIPNEWDKLAKVNIGVTAGIETTMVAPQWVEKSKLMDKIITISQHSKQVFERSKYDAQNKQTGQVVKDYCCTTPIDIVGYPIKNIQPADIDIDFKTDFNFLTVAQWGPRKNLENTIKWFVEEFIDQEVGLIVKTSIMRNNILDRDYTKKKVEKLLESYPNRKCKIYVLHGNMSEQEMTALYQHPKIKALISLSHGEGFGLPIYEAAYNNLPVIAVEWSGHLDFMTMPVKNKKGRVKDKAMFATVNFSLAPIQEEARWEGVLEENSQWAYADQGSYKMRLREVYKDHSRFISHAKKLKDYLLATYQPETQYTKFAESILGEKIQKIETSDLPKISIITSVFNGDDFIESFLQDMTRQTIFKEKCELILINANSPGNEEEIILKYKEMYPENIIYHKLEEDPGIYGVWNIGVEMSTGEYLTNANLDDRKAPWSLETHAKTLYANSNVDLVYADMLITDSPNETWEKNSSNDRKYNFPEYSFDNLKMVNMPHASPMWRRSLHAEHGFFNAKYRSAGDWEMWLRAASQGSVFKKINNVLGLYYFNPTGISTNPDNFSWKQEEESEIYETYADVELESEAA
jgi:glycosyltransferase involved in cell wall biosynthesis